MLWQAANLPEWQYTLKICLSNTRYTHGNLSSFAYKLFSVLWHIHHRALEHIKNMERPHCPLCAHGFTPTWTAAICTFGLQRWQGLEEQAEINWFASSEQQAVKRFYWSFTGALNSVLPGCLQMKTQPLSCVVKMVQGEDGRFPSLGIQCSSFQLCEKGKCQLQPLATPNKMLSSCLFFRIASEAEIHLENHLLFQLLIPTLI